MFPDGDARDMPGESQHTVCVSCHYRWRSREGCPVGAGNVRRSGALALQLSLRFLHLASCRAEEGRSVVVHVSTCRMADSATCLLMTATPFAKQRTVTRVCRPPQQPRPTVATWARLRVPLLFWRRRAKHCGASCSLSSTRPGRAHSTGPQLLSYWAA